MLLIDYREREFIDNLNKFIKTENDKEMSVKINNTDVVFKICSLPIGDFIINDFIVIERKTLSDLSSSITDGRFREQKQRLLESVKDPCRILYIIENNNGRLGVSETVLHSAMINLIFKHKYKMLQTRDNNDTFNNVLLLYKKIQTGDISDVSDVGNVELKLISKGDKIMSNVFINQMCVISGVSRVIADAIKVKYNTMSNLINEWGKLENIGDREKMLMDVKITEKRKVGKALSKKIYEAIW